MRKTVRHRTTPFIVELISAAFFANSIGEVDQHRWHMHSGLYWIIPDHTCWGINIHDNSSQ